MKCKVIIQRSIAIILTLCVLVGVVPISASAASKKPRLNMKRLELTVGDSFQLRLYNMKKRYKATYKSSNEEVVSIGEITKKGKRALITANAMGAATIRVTVKKGMRVVKRLKCKVKVTPNAVGIKFTKKNIRLETDEQVRLETIIKPSSSAEKPVFESDDTDVATVNSRGVVTAVSPGIVTITATLLSCNLTATCTIVVEEPEDEENESDDY